MSSGSILVTGGTGFLGRHVVPALVRAGYTPTLLQRSPSPFEPDLETVQVDPLEGHALHRALHGRRFDRVLHLAAYGVQPTHRDADVMFRMNVDVTRALAMLAGGWRSRCMVVAGSGSEYDLSGSEGPVGERHPVEVRRLYGASKAAGSICALAAAAEHGLSLAVARLFGIYGPGEAPHRLLPSLIARLLKRDHVPLSQGRQRRDFVYVADAVDSLLGLLTRLGEGGEQHVFNVSTGQPLEVRHVAEMTARAIGAPRELLRFGELAPRADEVPCFSGDPSRLRAYTGWRPTTELTSGIAECIRATSRQLEFR
jgi:nucleoside-diphosphate-sugar epimerase